MKSGNSSRTLGLCFMLLLALPEACTFTTTMGKSPVFNVPIDTLSLRLNAVIRCEHIDFEGSVNKTGSQAVSELTVRIINGKDIPEEQTQRTVLGKKIATLLKEGLKNPDDFDSYLVVFVTQKTSGLVTKSDYTGTRYKKQDL